jgi:hypothetical protein
MKFLIMQFSSLSRHFIPLRTKETITFHEFYHLTINILVMLVFKYKTLSTCMYIYFYVLFVYMTRLTTTDPLRKQFSSEF